MADLLTHSMPEIRERVCISLTILAGQASGREAIVKNKLILTNLIKLMDDKEEVVRHKAAVLMEMLSRTWFAADYLVEAGFIKRMMDKVKSEVEYIALIYLECLMFLMYSEGKGEALNLGAFDLFVSCMVDRSNEFITKAANCLLMLTSTYQGKEIAYDRKTLECLTKLLHSENEQVYGSAAAAIMFCTIKSRAKFRAEEIPKLLKRLIVLGNGWQNRSIQLHCLQALTNMCELPKVREAVLTNYLDEIEMLIVKDEVSKEHKEILLRVIKWRPESST